MALAVAVDPDLELLGEGVDHRDADAVQAARHLVARLVELAAGVQHGERQLDAGHLLDRVHVHRDAAAVVDDGDGIVLVDRDRDGVAVPGQRLVDRVVHHLVDEVMEPVLAGGPDVHRGPLADRLEPLEDGDRARVVPAIALRSVRFRHGFLQSWCQRSRGPVMKRSSRIRPRRPAFILARIFGVMRLSSLAHAELGTRTRRMPSGVTDSARVTAAICGPTRSAQSSTACARSSRRARPGARRVVLERLADRRQLRLRSLGPSAGRSPRPAFRLAAPPPRRHVSTPAATRPSANLEHREIQLPGNSSRRGAVTNTWRTVDRRRAARPACLVSSSSANTSSSRSAGSVPRCSAIVASSQSLSATAAVRCWPVDPNSRRSWPSSASTRSSRWGPTRRDAARFFPLPHRVERVGPALGTRQATCHRGSEARRRPIPPGRCTRRRIAPPCRRSRRGACAVMAAPGAAMPASKLRASSARPCRSAAFRWVSARR